MDDIQDFMSNDNDITDDSVSDSNDIGVDEISENEQEEIDKQGQDIATSPDYSDILSDISSNLSNVYEYLTSEPDEEITLTDIHNDMKILSCLILLFFGYMVMRSLVYKMRRF